MDSGRLHENAGEYSLALADYDAAVEQRPDMSAALLTRGQLYLRFYCWDDAAADFERGFALHPPTDPSLWLSHAYLRMYVGDADGYRRACAAMLDKFGQTTDPTTALDIAQACTAGPDALPDYTRVIRLMDVIKADPNNPSLASERDVQLALLSFRAGRIDQAIAMVEDKAHDPNEHPEWNDIGFAAAYHRAGQDDKARKLMAAFTEQSLDPLLDGELAVPSENEQPGCWPCTFRTISDTARRFKSWTVRQPWSTQRRRSSVGLAAPRWDKWTRPRRPWIGPWRCGQIMPGCTCIGAACSCSYPDGTTRRPISLMPSMRRRKSRRRHLR